MALEDNPLNLTNQQIRERVLEIERAERDLDNQSFVASASFLGGILVSDFLLSKLSGVTPLEYQGDVAGSVGLASLLAAAVVAYGRDRGDPALSVQISPVLGGEARLAVFESARFDEHAFRNAETIEFPAIVESTSEVPYAEFSKENDWFFDLFEGEVS